MNFTVLWNLVLTVQKWAKMFQKIAFFASFEIFVVAIVVVTIDVADISVCPPDHRRAFSRGTKCCFYEDFGTKFVAAWTTEFCPSGDSVNCSHASGCEDNPPSCYRDFEIEGFSPVWNTKNVLSYGPGTAIVTYLYCRQCDQIGRFFALWATFSSLWQQLICPNLSYS